MSRSLPKRFAVAFSLAGDQRDYIREIATAVELALGDSSVFFDEWYEHYISGSDADIKLQEIYSSGCELAVVCVSGAYNERPWTQAEFRSIRARYMEAANSPTERLRVLPVRVGDGDVDGFLATDVVPDVRGRSIESIVQLIVDRLALVGARPDSNGPNWPETLPVFSWPMADHTQAQHAFCELLTRDSPVRLLSIEGISGTGKSHLSEQMHRNVAEHLRQLRCGRFDFKGNANRTVESEALVSSLGLAAFDYERTAEPFGEILKQLHHSSAPTLLIFDTYEAAGESGRWLERVMLPLLLRSEWLRVVIVGQKVPSHGSSHWESIAAPSIVLRLPEPQDWLEYGKSQQPSKNIDIELVERLHELAGGKPALLRELLGPG